MIKSITCGVMYISVRINRVLLLKSILELHFISLMYIAYYWVNCLLQLLFWFKYLRFRFDATFTLKLLFNLLLISFSKIWQNYTNFLLLTIHHSGWTYIADLTIDILHTVFKLLCIKARRCLTDRLSGVYNILSGWSLLSCSLIILILNSLINMGLHLIGKLFSRVYIGFIIEITIHLFLGLRVILLLRLL